MLYAVGVCIAYVMGILWGLYLKRIALGVVFFCLLLLICCILTRFRKGIYFLMCASFLFGIIYINIRKEDFETRYIEGDIRLKGEILQKLEDGDYYNEYLFQDDDNKKFLLYIPKEIFIEENTVVFLNSEYEKPNIQRNRGGFNYANYLYSKNYYGIITVNYEDDIEILGTGIFHIISAIQNNIFEVLGKILPENQLGILLGMLIGDTSHISDESKLDFQKSGITHLLAVSGSNVAYVVVMTKFLFQKFLGKKISNIITILTISIFVLISGASASVVRAGIMAIIIILAEIFARAPNTYATVAVSALLILLYNPFIICDIGFILSFGGTLGIVLLNEKIKLKIEKSISFIAKYKLVSIIIDMLSVTLSAQIFLTPIMWFYFNQISIVSILTNLLVSSFTGVITIMGIVMYFLGLTYFPLAKLIGYSIYILISIILWTASICAKIPYGNILLPTIKITEMIAYYLILFKVFNVKKSAIANKLINVAICILILLSVFQRFPIKAYIDVYMIDVGQGDSTLIQTKHGKNILIDGGGSENSSYDVGEKILLPYLLDNTNGVIDYMFISHFHEDHAEGCISVLKNLKVKKIIIGTQPKITNLHSEVLKICKDKQIPIISVVAGDSINVDDVEFSVIFPKEKIEITDDLNNNSLVLKMSYKRIDMLFTGDIEIEAEEKITCENVKAEILKVAHHGSKTSTSLDFLKEVSPQIALISVGENNKFGHPSADVIHRLNEFRSIYLYDRRVWRTTYTHI